MNPSGTQALQRFIGFRKRKRFHLRAHWNFRRELHELRAVPARQVGHRTDRPFFPEKRIRKRWNVTHMDAARDHSAAFANSLVDELSVVGNSLVMPALNVHIKELFGLDFSEVLHSIEGANKPGKSRKRTKKVTATRRRKSLPRKSRK